MTLEEAREALERLRRVRNDLFESPVPEGCRRGIDVYSPEWLPKIFRLAIMNFQETHGRFPNLITPQGTVDHFFLMKFFDPIPMMAPGDKLRVHAFLPPEMLRQVGLPRRVWKSEEPKLPADDAIPARRYYFKLSVGNRRQIPMHWPILPHQREIVESFARKWKQRPYGLYWGEWWYYFCKPLFYMEESLERQMRGRPEVYIFVRRGVAKLIELRMTSSAEPKPQRFFDTALRPLEGVTKPERTPADMAPPEQIELMLKVAEEIGRHFKLVRVDFYNIPGPRPLLGEVSLCHNNARRPFLPKAFDDYVRALLFE